MVNYKRVVCAAAVLAVAVAAPAPDCKERETHYDQRQNGTENYRLNIDGVVIAVAPADSLLSAASSIDFNDLFDLEELNELQKPKPPSDDKPPKPHVEPKPQEVSSKPDSKPDSPPEDAPLSDVALSSDLQSQKKEAPTRKEKPLR
ncbi:uncharacterized protein LOC126367862 isoform X2 [Pectinophora gossypiella]|nr:uncharacterized protein LOC126367862 isoform X2 [Pectinophora gossypiella]